MDRGRKTAGTSEVSDQKNNYARPNLSAAHLIYRRFRRASNYCTRGLGRCFGSRGSGGLVAAGATGGTPAATVSPGWAVVVLPVDAPDRADYPL